MSHVAVPVKRGRGRPQKKLSKPTKPIVVEPLIGGVADEAGGRKRRRSASAEKSSTQSRALRSTKSPPLSSAPPTLEMPKAKKPRLESQKNMVNETEKKTMRKPGRPKKPTQSNKPKDDTSNPPAKKMKLVSNTQLQPAVEVVEELVQPPSSAVGSVVPSVLEEDLDLFFF